MANARKRSGPRRRSRMPKRFLGGEKRRKQVGDASADPNLLRAGKSAWDRLPERRPKFDLRPSALALEPDIENLTFPSRSSATLCSAASEVLLLIWEGQPRHACQAHWGMDSTQQPGCRIGGSSLDRLFEHVVKETLSGVARSPLRTERRTDRNLACSLSFSEL